MNGMQKNILIRIIPKEHIVNKNKYFYLAFPFVMFLAMYSLSYAQPANHAVWTLGGSNTDICNATQTTKDGGYVIAGATQSFGAGDYDAYIAKIDGVGNLQWTKTVGDTAYEEANAIQQTTDGGYIAVGKTISFGGGKGDMYVIKTDSLGNLEWTKTIGGNKEDIGYAVVQTTDGGFAVAGITNSYGKRMGDVYIVKLDCSGNLEWTRTVGGENDECGYSIRQTGDDALVIAGSTTSFGAGSSDIYLVKLDAYGSLLWTKTIGDKDSEVGYSIDLTKEGGYIIGGFTTSLDSFISSVYIVNIDAKGKLKWDKKIVKGNDCFAYSVQTTDDGGYILGGVSSYKIEERADALIIKLQNSGTVQWIKTIDVSDYENCNSIRQAEDGGYILGGYTFSKSTKDYDALVIKVDAEGNTCYSSTPVGKVVGGNGIIGTGGYMSGGGTSGSCGHIGKGGVLTVLCQSLSLRSLQTQSITCHGASNGSAKISIAGGTAPYNYLWQPAGGTNNTASNLTVGLYTVRITDASNTVITRTVSISQPEALISKISTDKIICHGDVTTAYATVNGGTPDYAYKWFPRGGNSSVAKYLSAGSYTVNVKDKHGCTSSTAIQIEQPPVINTTIENQEGILTAKQENAKYQWLDCNSEEKIIAGATHQSYLCAKPGSYAVIIEMGSCSVTSACIWVTTTDIINSVSARSTILLYPNPVNDILHLQSQQIISEVEIYSTAGISIATYLLNEKESDINLQDIPSGFYFVRMTTASGLINKKIVVKR